MSDLTPCPATAERDALEEVEGRLCELLWDLTGGRLSKANYPVATMAQAIEEYLGKYYESDATAERDALAAKVERVRALHCGEYVEDEGRNRCFECGDDWPCPTIRAIDGEVTAPGGAA